MQFLPTVKRPCIQRINWITFQIMSVWFANPHHSFVFKSDHLPSLTHIHDFLLKRLTLLLLWTLLSCHYHYADAWTDPRIHTNHTCSSFAIANADKTYATFTSNGIPGLNGLADFSSFPHMPLCHNRITSVSAVIEFLSLWIEKLIGNWNLEIFWPSYLGEDICALCQCL